VCRRVTVSRVRIPVDPPPAFAAALRPSHIDKYLN
jgi:hypothetical protein